MTVKELIELLKDVNPDAEVCALHNGGIGFKVSYLNYDQWYVELFGVKEDDIHNS